MPKFAANLDFLFTEHAPLERFAAAKASGFDAVEILFAYSLPPAAIAEALSTSNLELALINMPIPDWAEGGRGVGATPGKESEFKERFEVAIKVATLTRPTHLHIVAGIAEGAQARAVYIANLRWACRQSPDQSLTIEAINPIDMPGYYLNSFDLAAEILDEVSEANLHLQFDTYHADKIDGDISSCWARHGSRAAHVQVAGVPDRQEPHSGRYDHRDFFRVLDAAGYAGYVSGEYRPAGRTEDGLAWIC